MEKLLRNEDRDKKKYENSKVKVNLTQLTEFFK